MHTLSIERLVAGNRRGWKAGGWQEGGAVLPVNSSFARDLVQPLLIRFEGVGSGTRPVNDLALIQNIAPTSMISNRTTIRSVNVSNIRLINVSNTVVTYLQGKASCIAIRTWRRKFRGLASRSSSAH